METTGTSLLEFLTVHSSDFQTLKERFSSHLNPLNEERKKVQSGTPLPHVKNFLPFSEEVLHVIPGLIKQYPSLGDERAAAFLEVYRMVLHCMDSISPFTHGHSLNYQENWGSLFWYFEKWKKYKEAKDERVLMLRKLQMDVSNGAYGRSSDQEAETLRLVWIVMCSLLRSAYNSKSKDVDDYRLVLGLVELVRPKLRTLDPESMGIYHPVLVNSLYECLQFSADEDMT